MDAFRAEILKIPPVTRFLCISLVSVTLPMMVGILNPRRVIFVWESVLQRFEVWRAATSFFIGGPGINSLFDLVMLYRTSNQLEQDTYLARSADYAWQLMLASLGIIALNTPLHSVVHTRPLILALVYLSSALAPPGSQTSLMGLISMPVAYFPYALVGIDFLMGGPGAAAQGVSGLVVGHLWWWAVFGAGLGGGGGVGGRNWTPGWVWRVVGTGVPEAGWAMGGVRGIPPRRLATEVGSGSSGSAGSSSSTSGHQWGSGHRLGS